MFNGFIRSVQYLNNKYHPEIRKASEELQQKKDNWIKESVEFARRVCIEYPEYATMTNKLLYNIPIDETKLNNEEKVELMLSGFVSGFIKDSVLGLNGLADAAIYPIDTMEVLTSPDIASVAWDGMTRDIKADWKEGTIQGKSEAVGRTASVALPFLGVISKITKATGTAGKLTGTAAREAVERTAQEATERAGKEVSQEVAERARKTDNSIPVKRGDGSTNGSGVEFSGKKSNPNIDDIKTRETSNSTGNTEKPKETNNNTSNSNAADTNNAKPIIDIEFQNAAQIRVKELRNQLPNSDLRKYGNVATADVDIAGIKKEFYAHSKINSFEDKGSNIAEFSYLKSESERNFSSYKIDRYPRYHDTEAKILEDVASQIKEPNISGTINLFTERPPCESCSNIIEEFKEKFPNIELNVFSEKGKWIDLKKKGEKL